MAEPVDDLMSDIIRLELDGRALTQDELFRIAYLLFLAGLDTVAAALSFSFWYLAQSPDGRMAISTGKVPSAPAVEEMLRRNSFVNLARVVATDGESAGVQLRQGDPVVLSLPLASRDPDGRRHRRARRSRQQPPLCVRPRPASLPGVPPRPAGDAPRLRRVWHARIPDYHVDGDVGSYAGTVMGVTTLPLSWS